MGNCCRSPAAAAREDVKSSHFPASAGGKKKPHQARNGGGGGAGEKKRLSVLGEEGCDVGAGIEDKYALDQELGRGEFGVTYLCMDRGTWELLFCKSISKRKLRTPVDVEDVRREVAIMRHLPKSPNIVSLREACEDDGAVHLLMELCEGGELFDRVPPLPPCRAACLSFLLPHIILRRRPSSPISSFDDHGLEQGATKTDLVVWRSDPVEWRPDLAS